MVRTNPPNNKTTEFKRRTTPGNGNGNGNGKPKTKRPDMIGNKYAVGNKGGRPRKKIDYKTVEKLCALQCTGAEIASFLNIHYSTLIEHIQRDYGMSFPEYFELKSGAGRASLRRRQWQAAEKGNSAMLIWLGKQYLGQGEPTQMHRTELVGEGGGPIELKQEIEFTDETIQAAFSALYRR
ncbi:MAG: hypothetical protein ACOYCB_09095 [Fastidiosipilaceae bacterium]|jgi:hypothetical protein